MAERDLDASLLRYTGTGVVGQVEYAVRSDRRWLTLRLGGAIGTLRSTLTQVDGLPQQRTRSTWVELEYMRRLNARHQRSRLYFGGFLAARATGIIHLYSVPANNGAYVFQRVWLGPLVTIDRPIGPKHSLTARLGVPVLAVIGRPYGTLHGTSIPLLIPHLPLKVSGLPTFLAGDFALSYSARFRGTSSVVIGHHLSVEHYRGSHGVRIGSQDISVAMRFGGTP